MKILFAILTSKQHNHGDQLNIDRVDITRKVDSINTWVGDALYLGHDVLFFDGGNDTEYYDELSKTLHLTQNDGYESLGVPSRLLIKTQAAFRWILKNKEFDYLYLGDDDIFVNIPEFVKIKMTHDFMGTNMGGSGFFFNRKSMQVICDFKNTDFSVGDQAIYSAIMSAPNITKFTDSPKNCPFYFPGELYATIHYVTGKRSYFLHNIFRYYHENGHTNRKIILGGAINMTKENELVTYETAVNRRTKRWYDFTTDPNGWEYHGIYPRSMMYIENLKNFWPYANNATKYFVINFKIMLQSFPLGSDQFFDNLNFLIKKCEQSLTNKNNLLLCSDNNEYIEGWAIDNSVKESLKLNFEDLNKCNFYKKV